MHFVFEKIDEQQGIALNFIECADLNMSGIRRFTPCPIFISAERLNMSAARNVYSNSITYSTERPVDGGKYIIASGVAHSPDGWCGPDHTGIGFNRKYPNHKSAFAHLSATYLADLQAGRAFLLLDQSHEGYQVTWLWDWFHNNCEFYKINPRQVIYVTGNLNCTDQYNEWADAKSIVNKIHTIPYAHFENMVYEDAVDYKKADPDAPSIRFNLPNFQEQIKFKEDNIGSIKIYNALQKRPRAHRAWLFNELHKANLLNDGINSMNVFDFNHTHFEGRNMPQDEFQAIIGLLPMVPDENPSGSNAEKFASGDSGAYLNQFNENTMLNSWVTVISEASFGDHDHTCFISEKSFKPIACTHPFIMAGNRHSLKRFKEMGYMTFHPFIDESYDELPTWERMDAIIRELQRIKGMLPSKRLEWYRQMQHIFEHNHKTFYNNNRQIVPAPLESLRNYVLQTN